MSTEGRATRPPLRFLLCGQFSVERDGVLVSERDLGSRKARTLLRRLVVDRGHLVPTDRLADVLWADAPPQDPAANVATLVSRLRSVLGDGVIEGGRAAYGVMRPGPWTVDLDEATRLVAEAELQLRGGANGLAITAATAALDHLDRGQVLADEPSADWADDARREHARLSQRARTCVVQAALAAGHPERAAPYAASAVAQEPLDEAGQRDLMRTLHAAGRTAEAIDAYTELRRTLRDTLGTDPSRETQALYLGLLADIAPAAAPDAAPRSSPRTAESQLVGRDREFARLTAGWSDSLAGRLHLILIAGEAGIGKTRLAHEIAAVVENSGSTVLRVRCQVAERSLLLQPIVEALGPVLLGLTEADLHAIVGVHAESVALLVPRLAPALDVTTIAPLPGEIRRRRAYEAMVEVLQRLGARRPLLLLIDDLQNAGLSTVNLLHFAATHLGPAPVCVIATVRTDEGTEALQRLGEAGLRLDLGPLPDSAVSALAMAAGQADIAEPLAQRTRGHTLSVVEMLRAIAAGDAGVPATLTEAVLARVDRVGAPLGETIRAAAVLGVTVDPLQLANLLDIAETEAVRRCEDLLAARLFADRGATYEFANDLVQEVVLASVPGPTAHALHRRAADLLAARPEAMAVHAEAIGDLSRAARGWMLAAEDAARRAALEDAESLYTRAVAVAERLGDPELIGRAHLGRARVRVALTDFDAAWEDIQAATLAARTSGDRRLQLNVIGAMGSDVLVGRGDRLATSEAMIDEGLRLAAALGDRVATASLHGRWALAHMSRLRFDRALAASELALQEARGTGDPRALVMALDGVKATHAYLGDVDRLRPIVEELSALLHAHPDPNLVQWTPFEASFIPLAEGRTDDALAEIDSVVEINRRTGYVAYESFFLAHRAWVLRLAGRLDEALAVGAAALGDARRIGQRWWLAAAAGQHAAALLMAGQPELAERVAREGLDAARSTTEAYELRCLAPLAQATGDRNVVAAADRLLQSITAPPGRAWVLGADAYLCGARAHLASGDDVSAQRVLAPLREATDGELWRAVRDQLDAVLAET